MRSIASALLLGLLVLDAPSAPQVAEKKPSFALQLEASLRDGSRIKGEITPTGPLEVTSPVVGKVSIPLSKVSAITFSDDHEQATLRLQNGDKLQGALSIQSVKLTTLFGPITIPLTAIKELQIHSEAGGRGLFTLDDWEALPFPENSDWPGYRGERATINDGVISLHGQPLRTKRTCRTPVTMEFDVALQDHLGPDVGFQVQFIQSNQPRDFDLGHFVSVALNFSSGGEEGPRCTPGVDLMAGGRRPRERWRGNSFVLQVGKPYHLKVQGTSSEVALAIDDTEYRIPQIGIPYEEFFLQLAGWQPGNLWQVKNLRVY